jgi:transposase
VPVPQPLRFCLPLRVFRATPEPPFPAAWSRLGEDPRSGALFVFGNRRRNRIKILYFDGTGVYVLAKRLEEGTFAWPQSAGEPGAKIKLALQLLLDGLELKAGARRAWYETAVLSFCG